jgi:hypothetical protein
MENEKEVCSPPPFDLDEAQYFECACRSDEHTLKFIYVSAPDPEPEFYTTVFLNECSLPMRIWNAIKYVFGYKCKYGHFDCFMLREKDLNRLITLLQAYKVDFQMQKLKYAAQEAKKKNENKHETFI